MDIHIKTMYMIIRYIKILKNLVPLQGKGTVLLDLGE